MKTAVIVDCCRTPIGRASAEKGVFRDVRSDDLAVAVYVNLIGQVIFRGLWPAVAI